MNTMFKQSSGGRSKILRSLLLFAGWLSFALGVVSLLGSLDASNNALLDFAIRNQYAVAAGLALVSLAGAASAIFYSLWLLRAQRGQTKHAARSYDSEGLFSTGPGDGPPQPPKKWRRVVAWVAGILLIGAVVGTAYAGYRVYNSDQTDFLTMDEGRACQIRDYQSNHKLLLFIHGFNGDRAGTWEGFPGLAAEDERLKDFNICAVDYQTYVSRRNLDIDGVSQFIQSQMELGWGPAGTRKRYAEIDVIAHSMGGLVSRNIEVWDYKHGKRLEFDKVIEIGSPHGGSPTASASLVSRMTSAVGNYPQLDDMRIDSRFLQGLKSDWDTIRPAPIDFCIGSQQDEVVPLSSALYDCDPQRSYNYDGGSHTELVKPASHEDIRYRTPINLLLGIGAQLQGGI